MTLLVAILYFLAGFICIQYPARLIEWITGMFKKTTAAETPGWLKGRGIIFFVRLVGILALVNAVTLFYTMLHGR